MHEQTLFGAQSIGSPELTEVFTEVLDDYGDSQPLPPLGAPAIDRPADEWHAGVWRGDHLGVHTADRPALRAARPGAHRVLARLGAHHQWREHTVQCRAHPQFAFQGIGVR